VKLEKPFKVIHEKADRRINLESASLSKKAEV
jgi:hypothetical protein